MQFDPATLPYATLIDTFWRIHDPTSLNRQGGDSGTDRFANRGEQYRSVIFYHSPAQAQAARHAKRQIDVSGRYDRPIVTQIEPASAYWLASADHQRYFG